MFHIIIEWKNCCANLVHEFINKVISAGRKRHIDSFFAYKEDPFNTRWSILTIGEIIFKNSYGLLLRNKHVLRGGEWFWDPQGFFMDKSGKAYIKFIKEKKLILWKDNNVDNDRWKERDG